MKIALISSNYATTPYPVYPLGMSVIAQSLTTAGHEVVLLDLLMFEKSVDACINRLKAEAPLLVGISFRNIDNVNLLNEKRFVEVLEQLVRGVHQELHIPVVLGGAGYSLLPESILQYTNADYGIVGEGEFLVRELAGAIAENKAPAKGTIFRNENHLVEKNIGGGLYDANVIKHYHRIGGIAAVQTKRGCTLRCSYCSYPHLEGHGIRARAAVDVVDDVQRLIDEHKARYIFFADSVFNDSQGRYLEVLNEMKRRGLSVPWSAFIKPADLTEHDVALMKETGMMAAELGTDAASNQTLRGLHKPFKWDQAVEANNLFMQHGIMVAHYFMFGGPDETQKTILEGIDNICQLKCTAAFVFLGIRILPHTHLHQRAIREGVISSDNDLLTPVYYLSPQISRQWMQDTLTQAFVSLRHVLFPPDMMDDKLQLLHKMGFAGSSWELLNPMARV